MTQARALTILMTLILVGVQLAIFTEWRFDGVVVMLVWLWPVAVGLTGMTSNAILAGALGGLLFDAHSATPFGLNALVGALIAYGASRLGREGVGDLDSAALWVTPALAAAVGFLAPLAYTVSGIVALDFSLWRDSLVNAMVVNAIAFFLLARPLTRVALMANASAMRVRR